jgi:hypothetical protein
MTALAGYDRWKCQPPPDGPEPPDPHEGCDRTIAELERRVRDLEAALGGAAALIDYRPVPTCDSCRGGRPNADCICRGTGRYVECDVCGEELVHGHCLVLALPGRDELHCDAPKCVAATIQSEVMQPCLAGVGKVDF